MYQRKDSYYRKAKERGLRSRAAFKLEDLAKGVVRRGDRVLDLGSWPGGWLQVASHLVGEEGRVVGVDLRPLDPLGLRNVECVAGDVRDPAVVERLREQLGGPADVVLSDMAPKLSGIRVRDEAQADDLARVALDVARRILRPGGRFVCKVFMGPAYREFLSAAKGAFGEVVATRPESTRKGSAELYIVARAFRSGD